jgi:hypothetical protein
MVNAKNTTELGGELNAEISHPTICQGHGDSVQQTVLSRHLEDGCPLNVNVSCLLYAVASFKALEAVNLAADERRTVQLKQVTVVDFK